MRAFYRVCARVNLGLHFLGDVASCRAFCEFFFKVAIYCSCFRQPVRSCSFTMVILLLFRLATGATATSPPERGGVQGGRILLHFRLATGATATSPPEQGGVQGGAEPPLSRDLVVRTQNPPIGQILPASAELPTLLFPVFAALRSVLSHLACLLCPGGTPTPDPSRPSCVTLAERDATFNRRPRPFG